MLSLRLLREEKGLTQKDAASALNVAVSTYNQWETGKREPDCEMLQRIADYFSVSMDCLFGRETKTAPAVEPAEAAAPSREQMIEDIIRIYRQMSDAEKLDFLARLNAPKAP